MELWDAYDRDGRKLDFTLVRGEKIPEGVYHIVCEVLVRHRDGDFLLMKRADTKKDYPGYYEATCGGSALCGETPETCIRRELLEETGIDETGFEQVLFRLYDDGNARYYSYLCTTDWPKDRITLQEGETVGFKWVSAEEFLKFIKSPAAIEPQVRRFKGYLQRAGLMEADGE